MYKRQVHVGCYDRQGCTGVEDRAYGGKSQADSDGYTQDQEYEEGDK